MDPAQPNQPSVPSQPASPAGGPASQPASDRIETGQGGPATPIGVPVQTPVSTAPPITPTLPPPLPPHPPMQSTTPSSPIGGHVNQGGPTPMTSKPQPSITPSTGGIIAPTEIPLSEVPTIVPPANVPTKKSHKMLSVVLGIIILLILAGVAAAYMTRGQTTNQAPKPLAKACTQEARLCPDGSYVSRSGPSCAFASCPKPKPTTITNGAVKTYTNPQYSYSIQYPSSFTAQPTGDALWIGKNMYLYVAPTDPLLCKINCPSVTTNVPITIGAQKAKKVTGMLDAANKTKQEYERIIVPKDDMFYVLTLYALSYDAQAKTASTTATLAKDSITTFEKIATSLTFNQTTNASSASQLTTTPTIASPGK